ncbi:MAG: nitroreductase family protein [Streptosporangiaceae bacterium]
MEGTSGAESSVRREQPGAGRLSLTADDLLSTTRAVRKRLDFERDVEPELIEECIRLAQQAPSAYNTQSAHFVVVTDADKKAVLAELWRRGRGHGRELPISWVNCQYKGPVHAATAPKMVASASYLAENLHRAPAVVIPCVAFRTDSGESVLMQSLVWGAVLPAVWSFCLAARERGLGTCWTTIHLAYEREAAELLGIPYDDVMQVALLPVAYTKGTEFKPAWRLPIDQILHWDSW